MKQVIAILGLVLLSACGRESTATFANGGALTIQSQDTTTVTQPIQAQCKSVEVKADQIICHF